MDELDWIHSREVDDADPEAVGSSDGAGGAAGGSAGDFGRNGGREGGIGSNGDAAKKAQKDVYVKAPMDAAVAQHACPICQEEFRTVWHDGAQEWVWMDALSVVGKVYHKSCLDELAKDRGGSVRGVKKEAA